MKRKKIFDEIYDTEEASNNSYINDKDIINIICIDYYLLGKTIKEIAEEWGFNEDDVRELIENNTRDIEELEAIFDMYY